MILEDHDVESVEWLGLELGVRVGVSGGCRIDGVERDGACQVVELAVEAAGQIVLDAPLGLAAGYWHPGMSPAGLPPDWKGRERFSAVWSAPLGVLYDVDGISRFAFAFDCLEAEGELQFGASEESKTFVVRLEVGDELAAAASRIRLFVSAAPQRYERAIGELSRVLRAGAASRPLSAAAREPVFSTWYAYSQQVSAETVLADAAIARELGFASVFIDDGWQAFGDGRWYAGCGDWVADTAKFPDLTGTVDRLHELGLDVVLWIAPLLLGPESGAFAVAAQHATRYAESLRAWVLDPRLPEVRARIVQACARLVRDHRLDGLKIDFLNDAMVYAGTPSPGDVDDVGAAMALLLREVSEAVDAVRPGALIEYRQPYVSPAIAPYADVVRANDCPGDADQNRRSVLDLRHLADGQVVHSDPIMWDPSTAPRAVGRQLLNVFFSVPQVSMPLHALPPAHRAELASLLAAWRELKEPLLTGRLRAAPPSEGYSAISSRLGRTLVAAAYEERVLELDLDGVEDLVIVNGTSSQTLPYRCAHDPGVRLSGEAARHDGMTTPIAFTHHGFIDVPPWSLLRVRVHTSASGAVGQGAPTPG